MELLLEMSFFAASHGNLDDAYDCIARYNNILFSITVYTCTCIFRLLMLHRFGQWASCSPSDLLMIHIIMAYDMYVCIVCMYLCMYGLDTTHSGFAYGFHCIYMYMYMLTQVCMTMNIIML